ncbi:MAG TPA: FtsW/RodA/SpoVE family cell cycle protein, partial [Spirochaetota bacterium]|nr:FtsW/RodA/SpoVE family cell cycle protein [Spirochaetota bacterium]
MKTNKFLLNFDYTLFFSALFLTIIGIFFIYSANYNKTGDLQTEYLKQIIFLIVGLALLFTISFIPTRAIQNASLWFYAVCLLGIVLTLFFPEVKGQRRMNVLGFSFQFSEFMKIATIILLSSFYSHKSKEDIKSLKVYLRGALIAFMPVIFILLQPDLGTSLVYFPIFLSISFVAGVNKKFLLFTVLLIGFTTLIPVVTTVNHLFYNNENEIFNLLVNPKYIIILFATLFFTLGLSSLVLFDVIKGIGPKFKIFFFWYVFFCSVAIIGLSMSYPVNKFLKPYQKDRLLIFFNPYVDEKGSGYHIIQSITTIGNGGFLGKGWRKGEQVQKYFLPEQATDFIYPVIAEEMGFIGSLIILLLYGAIFFRGMRITVMSKDFWSSFTVVGLMSVYFFHILENMGMCIGVMPITGIPLP